MSYTLLQANDLLGRELHRRFDEYGPIQVFDDGNKRYLSFGTVDEQSCQLISAPTRLQHEYLRAMVSVLVQLENPQSVNNVTVLGLGGGSLAAALHELLPQTQIHAVELRGAVAQIAYQYFALPRDKRLKVHIIDAISYVEANHQAQQKTDILFSDLYLAEGLSEQQNNSAFLQQCAGLLTDNGWLVLNLWKEHRQDPLLLNQLKDLFPTLLQATTKDGNWLIWASRSAGADKKTAQIRAKQLQPLLGFNGWQSVKHFYRHR